MERESLAENGTYFLGAGRGLRAWTEEFGLRLAT